MKYLSLTLFMLLLAACSSAPEPLTAEQYPYYDECVFVEEYVDEDCEAYARAVDTGEREAFEEMCFFENKQCVSADTAVGFTDLQVSVEMQQTVSSARIEYRGLERECGVSGNRISCSLPLVASDRQYKQMFTLAVDEDQGKLLLYV